MANAITKFKGRLCRRFRGGLLRGGGFRLRLLRFRVLQRLEIHERAGQVKHRWDGLLRLRRRFDALEYVRLAAQSRGQTGFRAALRKGENFAQFPLAHVRDVADLMLHLIVHILHADEIRRHAEHGDDPQQQEDHLRALGDKHQRQQADRYADQRPEPLADAAAVALPQIRNLAEQNE